ncbi:hypothetical protein [Streptomyces caelestis]|uniref:hypothetical protein n=1 Tax=Streptomyces caelestis TaxID=36816 RepID=UPI00366387F4
MGGSGPPGREQRVELLNTRPGRRRPDVRARDLGCFGAEADRVGVFGVTAVPVPDRLGGAVTVWQPPS